MAAFDEPLTQIAEYVVGETIDSSEAYDTARACLADTLGCAMLALNYPACTKLLGPMTPGTVVPDGSHIPGTKYVLDPVQGAFTLGTMIRWLDFNDTWLAAEWGHPSDNLGGILAVADYLCRNGKPLVMRDVLTAMIKAHEIQGVIALQNSFNRRGLDHVILVRVATTAVVTGLLGGTVEEVAAAVSQAWIDGGALRTYRHAPNTGSRKSWAAGDATSRGVWLAMVTMRGEMGYTKALSAEKWGFYDVILNGSPLVLERSFGSYVMENVLFKIAFPAEFHAQTAVEAAFTLYPQIKGRWEEIDTIEILTHESALRIIDKTGSLHNPADRDHCLQYMVAIALLHGELNADHYEDETAQDPRIDSIREKMTLRENPLYSQDYLDPNKRSVANALTIRLTDGTQLGPIIVEYPLGHRQRRQEAFPLLFEKFAHNVGTRFSEEKVQVLMQLFGNPDQLDTMSVTDFVDLLFLS